MGLNTARKPDGVATEAEDRPPPEHVDPTWRAWIARLEGEEPPIGLEMTADGGFEKSTFDF